MKSKVMLLILALTVASWAQTATQTNPAPSPGTAVASSETKAQCPCCQRAEAAKTEMACCAHPGKTAPSEKSAMSCCEGKDAMAGMKGKPGESTCATSNNGKCCGSDQKDCCGKSDKAGEQVAMACCGGAGGHCGMDHQHDQGGMNK